MAAFTLVHWLQLLPADRALELGLSVDQPAPVPGKTGPTAWLTPVVESQLAELVERRRKDINDGVVRVEHYGVRCPAAAAMRSLALDEYRARLRREGKDPGQIERQLDELSSTPEFQERIDGFKVTLSRARRRSGRPPA